MGMILTSSSQLLCQSCTYGGEPGKPDNRPELGNALNLFGRLLHEVVRQKVHRAELVVLAPDLPGTAREVLKRGQVIKSGQRAFSRHSAG